MCHSWPGLRDWVLCITSCSLRAIQSDNTIKECLYGTWECKESRVELVRRFRGHLTACILLTTPLTHYISLEGDMAAMWESVAGLDETNVSGSIGGPRPDQKLYSERKLVSSRRCPRFTPGFLTCLRHASVVALHEYLGLTFIRKPLILYKQLMLLRFSSLGRGFETSQCMMTE